MGGLAKKGFGATKRGFGAMGAGLKKGFGAMGGLAKKGFGATKKGFGAMGAGLKKGFGAMGRGLKKGFGAVGGLAKRGLGATKRGFGAFGAGLKKGFGAMGRGLGALGRGIKRGAIGFKNTLSNLIRGKKVPKLAPLSPAAIAANARGKAFCSANCVINPAQNEKKCLDNGKLIPCKRCTARPGKDLQTKQVCELVCNGNLPMSPCDFYGYLNNKKKTVNIALLSKFGLTIVRRK